jgi:hypothetical protein
MYGPAVRCKRLLSIWQMRSCINVSGLRLERAVLLAIMDIRARPISFADRPSKASGSPDHERDGETVLPFFKSNSQTSAGISHFKCALGLTEAIPSEPPSLARPDGRATVARRVALFDVGVRVNLDQP